MGGEQKSVLLIDDEPFFLVMGQDLLEEKGYRVITAQSGREGLEKARTIRSTAILLEVVMPEMDGFETCERLKADPLTQDIPIIMLTASEDAKPTRRPSRPEPTLPCPRVPMPTSSSTPSPWLWLPSESEANRGDRPWTKKNRLFFSD